eukprot:1774774-Pyramimonas_sp.AAC.1
MQILEPARLTSRNGHGRPFKGFGVVCQQRAHSSHCPARGRGNLSVGHGAGNCCRWARTWAILSRSCAMGTSRGRMRIAHNNIETTTRSDPTTIMTWNAMAALGRH